MRSLITTILLVVAAPSALAQVHAVDPAQFKLDTGLDIVAVTDVYSAPGTSHYRMRTYQFRALPEQWQPALRALRMRLPNDQDPFDQAIQRLFDVARPQAQLSRKDLYALLLERGPHDLWGFWWLLPPYQQLRIACYPQPVGYGFRIAIVDRQVDSAGRRLVHFGASDLPIAAASNTRCEHTNASFFMPAYAFLNVSRPRLLPFPFAERSFDEMVSPTLPSADLRYHGTFFIDSGHFFRFALDQRDFRELVAIKSLQRRPIGESDHGFGQDAFRLKLDWWISRADAARVHWYELCQRFGTTPTVIRAAWHQGKVYWFSNGESGPNPRAKPCNSVD